MAGRRPKHEANYILPSSVDVMNVWSYTSNPPRPPATIHVHGLSTGNFYFRNMRTLYDIPSEDPWNVWLLFQCRIDLGLIVWGKNIFGLQISLIRPLVNSQDVCISYALYFLLPYICDERTQFFWPTCHALGTGLVTNGTSVNSKVLLQTSFRSYRGRPALLFHFRFSICRGRRIPLFRSALDILVTSEISS
jgi:hypothetical protein